MQYPFVQDIILNVLILAKKNYQFCALTVSHLFKKKKSHYAILIDSHALYQ